MPDSIGEDQVWLVRIAAARDAQNRTRLAFLVATIVAVAIGISEFNSSFSWYLWFAQENGFAENQITREVQKDLLQEFVKGNRMTISLLGVNFGMSDAAVIGSIALAIMRRPLN